MRREDFEFTPNDHMYKIEFEEGKQIVGFFAKLRKEEIEVEEDATETTDESAG